MILDLCENWADYAYGNKEIWAKAFEFVGSLKPDCEDGKYEIMGDDMFVLVQSYDTRDMADKLEFHHDFIDIQTLLLGSERMFYSDNSLDVCDEYDADNDVAFYKYDADKTVEYTLTPGVFTMFFPKEGHMPAVALKSGSAPARKAVIKIAAKFLMNS
jgi:YhcH/YjgK/YiaL family protein